MFIIAPIGFIIIVAFVIGALQALGDDTNRVRGVSRREAEANLSTALRGEDVHRRRAAAGR